MVRGNLAAEIVFYNTPGRQVIKIASSEAATDDVWYSTGFTYDGSTVRVYFDGVETNTLSINDTIRHNFISPCGKRVLSSGGQFNGELYDFVVYDDVLMPGCIGIFRPEGGSKGINVGHGQGEYLRLQLAADGEKGRLSEEIFLVVYGAVFHGQVIQVQGGDTEHFAGPFRVAGGDHGGLDE